VFFIAFHCFSDFVFLLSFRLFPFFFGCPCAFGLHILFLIFWFPDMSTTTTNPWEKHEVVKDVIDHAPKETVKVMMITIHRVADITLVLRPSPSPSGLVGLSFCQFGQ
jgi:hypothetical protein